MRNKEFRENLKKDKIERINKILENVNLFTVAKISDSIDFILEKDGYKPFHEVNK